MLPTPSTTHVNYDRVYEPAEDSYLLLDTLSSETETTFLQGRFPPTTASPLALEVGTGSGVVLAFLTAHSNHIFGRSDIAILGVDVNEFAARATTETVVNAIADARNAKSTAGIFTDCVVGDLTTVIKPESVDILIFNPPYVPTESVPSIALTVTDAAPGDSFARDSHLLSLSTDGGIDGMEITNQLLAQLPEVLGRRGVAYILLCAGNRPEKVMYTIHSWPSDHGHAWEADIVGSSGKKAGWEKLCVIRVFRRQADTGCQD
jgi:release factor glutamine methyltransferase